jgi:hypothetical protein
LTVLAAASRLAASARHCAKAGVSIVLSGSGPHSIEDATPHCPAAEPRLSWLHHAARFAVP